MTVEILKGIVGTVLSLVFAYVPVVSNWYYAFNDNKKKLIMLGFIALVSGFLFGLSCLGWNEFFGIQVFACSQAGLVEFIKIFISIAITNQITASIVPQTKVRLASPE